MQRLGLGYEFYKQFIDENLYYIDKTKLISDVIEKGSKVTLFTRPRRFGKTMALTTLQTYFECEIDRDGNKVDNSRYFEGKKIMEAEEEILSMMGQYPVIFMTLKSAKQPNFATAFRMLRYGIIQEIRRHSYLWETEGLKEEEKEALILLARESSERLSDRDILDAEVGRYANAIQILSVALEKYHGKKVIILLDEYDVPLENAYFSGFYEEMVSFIRSLFESSLKTNTALERAVVTGCLRISKESIFTGLNHLVINSMLGTGFSEGFGFTPKETEELLKAYGLEEKMEEVQDWYNGYLFGETEIYNPWSVLSYVYEKVINGMKFPKPFWANTSSNSIIHDLVEHATDDMKEELDRLVAFGTIEKKIHEDITYDDIHKSEDNLWNFLFFTGYMRKVSERTEDDAVFLTMRIPNREIRSIYRNQISEWFDRVVKAADRSVFQKALLSGDTKTMNTFVTRLLKESISTFDSSESFYHGFLLSILIGTTDYRAKSNREEGDGRPDIVLYPMNPEDPAIILELKIRDKYNKMQEGIEESFAQIRDKRYEEGILEDGYNGVISFGGCFCKKSAIFEKMGGK